MLVLANGSFVEQSIWQEVFNLPQYRLFRLRLFLEKFLVKRHWFLISCFRLSFLAISLLALDLTQLVTDLVLDPLFCFGYFGRREAVLFLIRLLLDFRLVGKCTDAPTMIVKKWRLDP